MNSLNNLKLHEFVVEFGHIIRGGGEAMKLWTWGGAKQRNYGHVHGFTEEYQNDANSSKRISHRTAVHPS